MRALGVVIASAVMIGSGCAASVPVPAKPTTMLIDRDLVILAVDASLSTSSPGSVKPFEAAMGLFRNVRLEHADVTVVAFADKTAQVFPMAARTAPANALLVEPEDIRHALDRVIATDRSCRQPPPLQDHRQLNPCVTSFQTLFRDVMRIVAGESGRRSRKSRVFLAVFSDGKADADEGLVDTCVGQRDGIAAHELTDGIRRLPLSVVLVFTGVEDCAQRVYGDWSAAFRDVSDDMAFGFESIGHVGLTHVRQELIDRILRQAMPTIELTSPCEIDKDVIHIAWRVSHGHHDPVWIRSRAHLESNTIGDQSLHSDPNNIDHDLNQLAAHGSRLDHTWHRLRGREAVPDDVEVIYFFRVMPELEADAFRDRTLLWHLPEEVAIREPCAPRSLNIDLDLTAFQSVRYPWTPSSFSLQLRARRLPSFSGEPPWLYYWNVDPDLRLGGRAYPTLEVNNSSGGADLSQQIQIELLGSASGWRADLMGAVWLTGIEFNVESTNVTGGPRVRVVGDNGEVNTRRILTFQFHALALLHYWGVCLLSVGCFLACWAHLRLPFAASGSLAVAWSTFQTTALIIAMFLACYASMLLSYRPIWLYSLSKSMSLLGAGNDWVRACPLLLTVGVVTLLRVCLPRDGRKKRDAMAAWAFRVLTFAMLGLTLLIDWDMLPVAVSAFFVICATGKADNPLSPGDAS